MHQKGLTIIQLMVVLLIAGLVGFYVVEFLIDMRCDPASDASLCEQRSGENAHRLPIAVLSL